jgi:hypothetical protein
MKTLDDAWRWPDAVRALWFEHGPEVVRRGLSQRRCAAQFKLSSRKGRELAEAVAEIGPPRKVTKLKIKKSDRTFIYYPRGPLVELPISMEAWVDVDYENVAYESGAEWEPGLEPGERFDAGPEREAAHDYSAAPSVESSQPDDDHLEVNVRAQSLVMNVEELIRVSQLDVSKWEVTEHKLKTWSTPMKIRTEVDTGKVDKDGNPIMQKIDRPTIVRNWQVWAMCERKHVDYDKLPALFVPLIRRPSPKAARRFERAYMLGDPQIGFRRDRRTGRLEPLHCRYTLDIFVQVCALEQPEYIFIAGDTGDFAEMSLKYPVPLELQDTTIPTLAEIRYWLAQLRASCPHSRIICIEGNHWRLRRLTGQVAPAADLAAVGEDVLALSPERLLKLEEIDVEWVGPYGASYWLWAEEGRGVRITHGEVVRAKSGATASFMAENNDYSTAVGHVHRVETAHRTLWGPEGKHTIFAGVSGCACRLV